MVFSSLIFTFYFLPVVLLLYYVFPRRFKNIVLLLASFLFYGYGEPYYIFIMFISISLNYGMALAIDYNKKDNNNNYATLLLVIDVTLNLGILFVFKYLDFSVEIINSLFHDIDIESFGIALPIGISFFTFQAISYVVDVYRGTVKVQKNPLYVALYISFFPQLVAGPIVRYSTIEEQLIVRKHSFEKFSMGAQRFILGFCKKILIANNLSVAVEMIHNQNVSLSSPITLWIGAICYSLQIFFDFSGYSDMAIGIGKMFGFEFEENFNYPYISKSITEFWRRWHISLGQWFRDYIYFPLGGSRVTVPRHIFNLFIVWTLTGIWHGANYTFLVWGLFFFGLLVIEKYIIKPQQRNKCLKMLWMIVTLLCINFGWVIFYSSTIKDGLMYSMGMLGCFGVPFSMDGMSIRVISEYGIFIIAGLVFSTPIIPWIKEHFKYNKIIYSVEPFIYFVMFMWAVSFLILGAHNPFIYFNF